MCLLKVLMWEAVRLRWLKDWSRPINLRVNWNARLVRLLNVFVNEWLMVNWLLRLLMRRTCRRVFVVWVPCLMRRLLLRCSLRLSRMARNCRIMLRRLEFLIVLIRLTWWRRVLDVLMRRLVRIAWVLSR